MDNPLQVRLQPATLAGLYKNVLVDIRDGVPAGVAPQPVSYLGGFAKQVCIFVAEPEHTFVDEERLSFLLKMLSACKLNNGDVAIVNLARQDRDEASIVAALQPAKAISFQHSSSASPVETITRFGIPFVQAPPLEVLMRDSAEAKALKSALWTDLKKIFTV